MAHPLGSMLKQIMLGAYHHTEEDCFDRVRKGKHEVSFSLLRSHTQ